MPRKQPKKSAASRLSDSQPEQIDALARDIDALKKKLTAATILAVLLGSGGIVGGAVSIYQTWSNAPHQQSEIEVNNSQTELNRLQAQITTLKSHQEQFQIRLSAFEGEQNALNISLNEAEKSNNPELIEELRSQLIAHNQSFAEFARQTVRYAQQTGVSWYAEAAEQATRQAEHRLIGLQFRKPDIE
jgi:hypothetical protein